MSLSNIFIYLYIGKDLSTLYPTLQRLHDKYGLDLCGEGGEYESIVVDCPVFLSGRIHIISSDIIYDDEDISVGNLRVLDCEVIEKLENIEQHNHELISNNNNNNNKITWKCGNLSLIFQDNLLKLLNTCNNNNNNNNTEENISNNNIKIIINNDDVELSNTEIMNGICLFRNITDVYSTSLIIPDSLYITINSNNNITEVIKHQLQSILKNLTNILQSFDAELLDIVFIHLYISNMDLFKIVNDEYCKWFSRNPPSRSCIAVSIIFLLLFILLFFIYNCYFIYYYISFLYFIIIIIDSITRRRICGNRC
jgi:diphthine-ammonia ligase